MLDEVNIRHRAVYDEIADRFARVNAEMPASYLGLAGEFGKLAGDGPILDLGCGAGRDMALHLRDRRRLAGPRGCPEPLTGPAGQGIGPLRSVSRTMLPTGAVPPPAGDCAETQVPR